jgi:hypothetical protein
VTTQQTGEFVVVWRAVEGSAVQTYANEDKSPKVFEDPAVPEAAQAEWVDADAFSALLANREAFLPKCVTRLVAHEYLGWEV